MKELIKDTLEFINEFKYIFLLSIIIMSIVATITCRWIQNSLEEELEKRHELDKKIGVIIDIDYNIGLFKFYQNEVFLS